MVPRADEFPSASSTELARAFTNRGLYRLHDVRLEIRKDRLGEVHHV